MQHSWAFIRDNAVMKDSAHYSGGVLKYIVVSWHDQENTVKGLFFVLEQEVCAAVRAACLGVQKKEFSTNWVSFSKFFRF